MRWLSLLCLLIVSAIGAVVPPASAIAARHPTCARDFRLLLAIPKAATGGGAYNNPRFVVNGRQFYLQVQWLGLEPNEENTAQQSPVAQAGMNNPTGTVSGVLRFIQCDGAKRTVLGTSRLHTYSNGYSVETGLRWKRPVQHNHLRGAIYATWHYTVLGGTGAVTEEDSVAMSVPHTPLG